MRYNIMPVGNDAATIRENKSLIRQLVRRLESGMPVVMTGQPPLGTRHIGDEFHDGHYRRYYYSKVRDEYFCGAVRQEKRR